MGYNIQDPPEHRAVIVAHINQIICAIRPANTILTDYPASKIDISTLTAGEISALVAVGSN